MPVFLHEKPLVPIGSRRAGQLVLDFAELAGAHMIATGIDLETSRSASTPIPAERIDLT